MLKVSFTLKLLEWTEDKKRIKMNKIIIQITSGRGPVECCFLVAKVLEKMINEAANSGLNGTILKTENGPKRDTFHSVSLQLEGHTVREFANEWLGSILWVMESPFRKYHKRKNWYVAVNLINLPEETLHIPDCDISYQAIRSGGPGGQHVNKVSTAIRAIHLPSKANVLVSDSRSQVQNKKLAKERLVNLLKLEKLQENRVNEQKEWMNHNYLQRGNPVKVFVGSDFKLKKERKTI